MQIDDLAYLPKVIRDDKIPATRIGAYLNLVISEINGMVIKFKP